MSLLVTIASSAVVSGAIGSLVAYLGQRRLAERQASINYEAAARKRLYEVIGPLRFQLLVAVRDVLRRMTSHHLNTWDMDPANYYANSFIYRLLRPLAIGELVETQMNFADFSVDSGAVVDLLRFQTAAYRLLAGSDPLPYYSALDWTLESQHVLHDNLRVAARRLLDQDENGQRYVIDYGTFAERYKDLSKESDVASLVRLFASCTSNLTENPVWWTRLVGYAYACNWFLMRYGPNAGFAQRSLSVAAMLAATGDAEITAHLTDYPGVFDNVMEEPM